MRAIERLIVLLLLLLLPWSALLHRYPLWFAISLVLTALLVPLHGWIEGLHWQMLPACLAALLLPLTATGLGRQPAAREGLLAAAALLLLASMAFSWALPMFRLPKPTGPYSVGTRLLSLVDASRAEMHPGAPPGDRELVVQLWYPASAARGKRARYRRRRETRPRSSYQAVLKTHCLQDAPLARGRFPLIFFNHGWHGFRNRAAFMTQELASQGFIVAAISHTYNSSWVELPGGRIARYDQDRDVGFLLDHYIPLEQRFAMADWELRIQVDDCRFVLNEMEKRNCTAGDPLEGRLETGNVGAFGHSFGGAVCAEFAREEKRVRSVLTLDGVLHGAAAVQGLAKPFMMIDSEWFASPKGDVNDADRLRAETAQMWRYMCDANLSLLNRFGGLRLTLKGTNHENFSDVGFMSPWRRLSKIGPLPQKRVAEIVNAYLVAFFRETLLEEHCHLLSAPVSAFAEATLEIWPAPALEQGAQSAGSDPNLSLLV